jgi:hypothetical protein
MNQYERYAFKGWTKSKYESSSTDITKIEFIKVKDLVVKGTTTLYPYFAVEDARYTPSNEWYFTKEES